MTQRNTVEFQVTAPRALFSDPVTRVGGEKTSYYVPTYEALKGIANSIYWKPTFMWIIDSVRVLNIIQTQSDGIRTKNYNGGNDLSIYTYLSEVGYQVRAHFEWNLNRPELEDDRSEHKHHNIAKRMIERGGRRDIFLGARECQGYAEPCVFGEGTGAYYKKIPQPDLGYMFHGFTYADEAVRDEEKGHLTARFHKVVMINGVINFPHPEDIAAADRRIIKTMDTKKFGTAYNNFTGADEFEAEGAGL